MCDTRIGRRKPFIIVGTILSSLGLLILANAEALGNFFGDKTNEHNSGIAFAVISLWIVNIGLNAIQPAAIALMLDVCGTEQSKNRGTAVISALNAAASLVAFGLGFLNLRALLIFTSNAQGLFYVAIVMCVISNCVTIFTTKEETLASVRGRQANGGGQGDEKRASRVREFLSGAISVLTKPQIVVLLIVGFLSNAAESPVYFFYTDYVAEDVFHGFPNSHNPKTIQLYKEGVRYGSLCMAANNLVMLLYSFALPYVHNWMGLKWSFLAAQLICSLSLIPPFFSLFATRPGALLFASLNGIFEAAYLTAPYILLGMWASPKENGIVVGLMTTSHVLGQILCNFLSGLSINWFHKVGGALLMGGIFSCLSALSILFIKVPKQEPRLVAQEIQDVEYHRLN